MARVYRIVGVGAVAAPPPPTIQLAATEAKDQALFLGGGVSGVTVSLAATETPDRMLFNLTGGGLMQMFAAEARDRAFFDVGGAAAIAADPVMLIGV